VSWLFDTWLVMALFLGVMALATEAASDKNQQLIDASVGGDRENVRALIGAG